MNPYLVLGITPGATDAVIRQAYLDAVKASPPDLDPVQFQAVATAYGRIKDESSRHAYTLFDETPLEESPVKTFLSWVSLQPNLRPLPLNSMKTFLHACSKK